MEDRRTITSHRGRQHFPYCTLHLWIYRFNLVRVGPYEEHGEIDSLTSIKTFKTRSWRVWWQPDEDPTSKQKIWKIGNKN